jgi:hypothetical protein
LFIWLHRALRQWADRFCCTSKRKFYLVKPKSSCKHDFVFLFYFLLALKESSKENAPKNPTKELCSPQASPNKGAKFFGSHIFGGCHRADVLHRFKIILYFLDFHRPQRISGLSDLFLVCCVGFSKHYCLRPDSERSRGGGTSCNA